MEKGDIGKYVLSSLRRGLDLEEVRQQLLIRNFSDYDINEEISKLDLREFTKKKEEKSPVDKKKPIEGWDTGFQG